jgi:glycosyltransferase involved in cell wall biosynthesis
MTFIANELRFLLASEKVKEVKVYTDFPIEDEGIAFHDKCTVFIYGKIYQSALNIPFISIALNEVLGHFFWYLRRNKWTEVLLTMRDHLKKATLIKENGIPDDAILYSYWAGSGAFIISCLKRYGLENLALTRMHGFDLYEEGNNHGHIPWRSFIFNNLNYLLPISNNGKIYLLSKYPIVEKKINVFNIGIYIKNIVLNLFNDSDMYHVVSCAWVGEHKNLKGIYEAIKSQKYWEWTHIGDGEYFNTLNNHICLDSLKLIKVNLIGRLNTDQINTFYREKKITCFISLSPNEGLPVSMMEAMAFGIPVVSTDVGGCAEIVTPETGVLLPKNYTNDDVVAAVKQCAEKFASLEARNHIQQFIIAKFDAEKNYQKFIDYLEEANKKHRKAASA